jgi:hypothetical protein
LASGHGRRRHISDNNEPRKQSIMKAVIRKYSGKGAKELMEVLEERAAELDSVMGSIKGLVSYTLARSGDGGFSVTVCQDQAGLDESIRRAKDWVAKNAAGTGVAAPEVIVGDVIKQL